MAPLKKTILSLCLLAISHLAFAADLAREKRIAEQIEEAILDGEVVYLKEGAHDFLAIHTETDSETPMGAALILHGKGANPDWIDVIQPLRIGLTEHSWETLSIQLPVAHEGASDREWLETVAEAVPRIDAAIAYLEENNFLNIVIISHSFGARMAAAYLAQDEIPEAIRGFVAIGMSINGKDDANLEALSTITIPTYDLYGERDLPAVLSGIKPRKIAAQKATNEYFKQTEVPGADHFFVGQEDILVSKVRAWLSRYASGTEVRIK